MKTKKTLIFVLAVCAAALFGLLTGCGKKAKSKDGYSISGLKNVNLKITDTAYDFTEGVKGFKDGAEHEVACDSGSVKFGVPGVYYPVYSCGGYKIKTTVTVYGLPSVTASDAEMSYSEACANSLSGVAAADSFGRNLAVTAVPPDNMPPVLYEYGQTYKITYTAADPAGQTAEASRNITVIDGDRPVFEQKTTDLSYVDLTVPLKGAQLIAVLDGGGCELEGIVNNNDRAAGFGEAFRALGKGLHTLTIVTSEGYGEFRVTITDNKAPQVFFDSNNTESGIDKYIFAKGEAVKIPELALAYNCYQDLEIQYSLKKNGAAFSGADFDYGYYTHTATVTKTGDTGSQPLVITQEFFVVTKEEALAYTFSTYSDQFLRNFSPINVSSEGYFNSSVEYAGIVTAENNTSYPAMRFNNNTTVWNHTRILTFDNSKLKAVLTAGLKTLEFDAMLPEGGNPHGAGGVIVYFYFEQSYGPYWWGSHGPHTGLAEGVWTHVTIDLSGAMAVLGSAPLYDVDEKGNVTLNYDRIGLVTAAPVYQGGSPSGTLPHSVCFANMTFGLQSPEYSAAGFLNTDNGDYLLLKSDGTVLAEINNGGVTKTWPGFMLYESGELKARAAGDDFSGKFNPYLYYATVGKIAGGKLTVTIQEQPCTFGVGLTLDDGQIYTVSGATRNCSLPDFSAAYRNKFGVAYTLTGTKAGVIGGVTPGGTRTLNSNDGYEWKAEITKKGTSNLLVVYRYVFYVAKSDSIYALLNPVSPSTVPSVYGQSMRYSGTVTAGGTARQDALRINAGKDYSLTDIARTYIAAAKTAGYQYLTFSFAFVNRSGEYYTLETVTNTILDGNGALIGPNAWKLGVVDLSKITNASTRQAAIRFTSDVYVTSFELRGAESQAVTDFLQNNFIESVTPATYRMLSIAPAKAFEGVTKNDVLFVEYVAPHPYVNINNVSGKIQEGYKLLTVTFATVKPIWMYLRINGVDTMYMPPPTGRWWTETITLDESWTSLSLLFPDTDVYIASVKFGGKISPDVRSFMNANSITGASLNPNSAVEFEYLENTAFNGVAHNAVSLTRASYHAGWGMKAGDIKAAADGGCKFMIVTLAAASAHGSEPPEWVKIYYSVNGGEDQILDLGFAGFLAANRWYDLWIPLDLCDWNNVTAFELMISNSDVYIGGVEFKPDQTAAISQFMGDNYISGKDARTNGYITYYDVNAGYEESLTFVGVTHNALYIQSKLPAHAGVQLNLNAIKSESAGYTKMTVVYAVKNIYNASSYGLSYCDQTFNDNWVSANPAAKTWLTVEISLAGGWASWTYLGLAFLNCDGYIASITFS